MAVKVLKLYRGLSSDEFNLATDEVFRQNKDTWASILAYRVKGNFKYPQQLDRSINALHKHLRLEYQYFTDSKVIAEGYARKVGGLLVELSVPLNEVLKHFDIEFQNFGRRKKQFEIVYCVKGSVLAKYGMIHSAKYLGGNSLLVRRAAIQDAESIHRAHMKSIQEICSKDHSPQEIQAWGHRPYREDQRVGSIKNDLVWVVEDNGSIEGYGHLKIFEKDGLKRGHIFGLYLTPNVVGISLGKAIVDLMMEEIKSAKVKQVSLEATITAQNFYRKVGFVDAGPETTVEISGTPIRCYPMKMELSY